MFYLAPTMKNKKLPIAIVMRNDIFENLSIFSPIMIPKLQNLLSLNVDLYICVCYKFDKVLYYFILSVPEIIQLICLNSIIQLIIIAAESMLYLPQVNALNSQQP